MSAVCVVQLGIADAQLHVGDARMIGRAIYQRTGLCANGNSACVAHRIAQKIRRQLLAGFLLAE